MAMPRFAVLKSKYNDKYMSYIKEAGDELGFLQFSGAEVVSPYSKFQVEMAKTGDGLVHLRCCYSSKYCVRRLNSDDTLWIVAAAKEPEEDQSKPSCTLFKPEEVDGDAKTVRFLHVQLGHYACLWRVNPPRDSCLYAASASPNQELCDVYTVIDWESLVILPKSVAFKSNDGKYLTGGFFSSGNPMLHFESTDSGDPKAGHEVVLTSDGNLRIKSIYSGVFWNRSNDLFAGEDLYASNLILDGEFGSTGNYSDTLFWPVRLGSNVIALRNLGNNHFCERTLTANESYRDYFGADVSTITQGASLEVEELVIKREIYNIQFRLSDARVYNEKVLALVTSASANKTDADNTCEFDLTYTVSKSSTWNASVSLTLGVTTTFECGIPLIDEGEIEISASVTGEYQWGETTTKSETYANKQTITVAARTKKKMSLIATSGTCDVPFSYTQRDTHSDGQTIITTMDDGIYRGINSYNIHHESHEEPL